MILTQDEYNLQKDVLLKKFAAAQTHQMHQRIWRIGDHGKRGMHAKLLWLFVYALNTWDHQDGAVNYMTERQVQLIFEKTNTL